MSFAEEQRKLRGDAEAAVPDEAGARDAIEAAKAATGLMIEAKELLIELRGLVREARAAIAEDRASR